MRTTGTERIKDLLSSHGNSSGIPENQTSKKLLQC